MTEHDELRERLAAAQTDNNRLTWALKKANDLVAAVEAERDALREQLEVEKSYCSVYRQRAEKVERILATVRTPSETVVAAGVVEFKCREKDDHPANVVAQIIYAAVAAAEREVDP